MERVEGKISPKFASFRLVTTESLFAGLVDKLGVNSCEQVARAIKKVYENRERYGSRSEPII